MSSSDSLSLILDDLSGDSVHIGGTFLGKGLTVAEVLSIFAFDHHLSDVLGSLKFLKAESDVLTSDESRVFSAGSVSLFAGVVLSESVDSNLSSHVELISTGGSSDVKPVSVIRSQVFVASSLMVNGPLWVVDLVTLLEMLGEGRNEFLSWDILDGDTSLFV